MFGPDSGYLYIGVGDGGSSYDPFNSGQSGDTLLGKMLRIDVDVADADPDGYNVPPSNPFLDNDPGFGVLERSGTSAFAIRGNSASTIPRGAAPGALFIADVGQNRWEEINWEPAGSGARNYGWSILEGTHPVQWLSNTATA